MDQMTLVNLHKDLTEAEEVALAKVIEENPVIGRWIALIEQDILTEERSTGAFLDMPPEQVKARQTYSAGKREVIATLSQTIHQCTK